MEIRKDMLVACCVESDEFNVLGLVEQIIQRSPFRGESIFSVEVIFPAHFAGNYSFMERYIEPIFPEVPLEGVQTALPDIVLYLTNKNFRLQEEVQAHADDVATLYEEDDRSS